jgi:hypothetical protein
MKTLRFAVKTATLRMALPRYSLEWDSNLCEITEFEQKNSRKNWKHHLKSRSVNNTYNPQAILQILAGKRVPIFKSDINFTFLTIGIFYLLFLDSYIRLLVNYLQLSCNTLLTRFYNHSQAHLLYIYLTISFFVAFCR